MDKEKDNEYEMTRDQMAARTAVMLSILSNPPEGLTKEEVGAINQPFSMWPQSLIDKVGPLAQTVKAEDARAAKNKPQK